MTIFKDVFTAMDRLDLEFMGALALGDTTDQLEERNREQLREGYTSEGKRLRPYRRAKYARIKNEMNPLPGLGNPDFLVSGEFYVGIRADATEEGVHIRNIDGSGKTEFLEQRDNPDKIYGLNPQHHHQYVTKDLWPAFAKRIKEATKLPMT